MAVDKLTELLLGSQLQEAELPAPLSIPVLDELQVFQIESKVEEFRKLVVSGEVLSDEIELEGIRNVVLLFRHRRNVTKSLVKVKEVKSKANAGERKLSVKKTVKATRSNVLDLFEL